MTEFTILPTRSNVPHNETWDLESIFATPAEWEAAGREIIGYLPQLTAFQGRLKEGPRTLLDYLHLTETVGILAGKYLNYASNYYAVDTTNQEAAARLGQARSMNSRLSTANAFFEPELVTLGLDQVEEWIKTTPELAYLAHSLDKLRRRQAHTRSGEVEQVLALTMDPFSGPAHIYSSLSDADLRFKPAVASDGRSSEVSHANLSRLLTNPDPALRRSGWVNYSDGYLALKNTFAANFAAKVKQDVFNMRARGYESSLQASLDPNNIPVEVFHNLLAVFEKNLPKWHRYWRLRKRLLGVDSLHVYDIWAPLDYVKPVIPFEKAVEWICEGMAPLGKEYVSILRRGCLDQRWVDRARNKGKSMGAFSSGAYGSYPFILLTYSDDIFSMSTLAHELGHSLHTYFSLREQPFIYVRYSEFEAEVASNFNQIMVRDYLLRTQKSRDFQLSLIEEAMSNFYRYLFIMPILARFEYEVHTRVERGAPLSADILIGLMAGLFKEGYGDEVVFDRDRIGITWAQFSHMYMNFYVYQYATGIAGARALVNQILAGDPGAIERYHGFLKSGGSRYPLDNLKQAGVDLAAPEPVESAFVYMAGLVDRLEVLLG